LVVSGDWVLATIQYQQIETARGGLIHRRIWRSGSRDCDLKIGCKAKLISPYVIFMLCGEKSFHGAY
jgi:hypothetical protein